MSIASTGTSSALTAESNPTDPAQDLKAFISIWNSLGEQFLAEKTPEEISDFIKGVSSSVFIYGEIGACEDVGDGPIYTLRTVLEFED